MSYLLNSATDISLRAKKLRADEIEIYDPVTEEFVPIGPGGGGGGGVVPSYAKPTLIDFGEKRMKINQSHLEVGDVGSAMRKTEVKASGLDVTDDAGNNAKIEGGAIYFKKGEVGTETVTMAYEDIAEVVDKIKSIEYLKEDSIDFNTDGETSATKIAGNGIATYMSIFEGEGKLTQLTPTELWHIDPAEEEMIHTTYPLIINAANKLAEADYLKEDAIIFTNSPNPRFTISSASNNMYLASDSIHVGSGPEQSTSNRSLIKSDRLLINGASTNNNTEYRNKEIIIDNATKTINLVDLQKSQENYLKPDAIEFDDGSGISEGFLHYVDDDSTLKSKSIKDIANASSGGGTNYEYLKPDHIEITTEGAEKGLIIKRGTSGESSEISSSGVTFTAANGLNTTFLDYISLAHEAPSGGLPPGEDNMIHANTRDIIRVTKKLAGIQNTAEKIDAAVSGRYFSFYIMNWALNTVTNRVMMPNNANIDQRTLLRLNRNVITESRCILFRFNNYPTGIAFTGPPQSYIEFSFEVAGTSTDLPRFSVDILDVMTTEEVSPYTATIRNSFTAIPMKPTWIDTSPVGWSCKWILFQTGPAVVNFSNELLEMTAAIRFYRTGTSNSSDMVNYLAVMP